MDHNFKIMTTLFLLQTLLLSNPIDKSIDVIEKTNIELKTYQQKINKEDERSKILLEEYKYTNKELTNTIKYNKQLDQLISSQKSELKDIEQQLLDIEQTHKNIYPLMSNMIKSLKILINEDTPFLLDERKKRVEKLEQSLDRADIKTAEKFRIILEAFKIEYDYANSIESYEAQINNKTYTFLRIGRVGLYSQSLDFQNYMYWNNTSKQWESIENSTAKSNIRKAIKIANKQQNVELLELPFFNPKG